ncbi:MAG: oligosaccharide flippase family protein [Acidimicrobiia bacterium]|nr:oligosaccharide flippase family protein [Acidimicrobiia bacterium]
MRRPPSNLASGAVVLGLATLVASASNYALNVILGRWLGPAAFGEVALMLTLLMLSTVITTSVQLVTAKTVAEAASDGERSAAIVHVRRRAGRVALVVAGVVVLVSPALASALQVRQPLAVIVMAVGLPVHLRLAVDRGILQGDLRLGRVAASFVAEAAARIGSSVVFVLLGWGVVGATIGLNLAFVGGLAMTVARTRVGASGSLTADQATRLRAAGRQVSVLLVATTIINNGDVVAAKFFLDPSTAGRYAAIALVGRAIFFLSWSAQQAVVPVAARSRRHQDAKSTFEIGSVIVTAVMAFGTAGVVWVLHEPLVEAAFGAEYVPLAGLLGPYAVATACWAVANVIVSIEVSRGQRTGAVLAAAAAVVQTVAVMAAGSSAGRMVTAQVWVMAALLVAVVGAPAIARRLTARSSGAERMTVGATA